MENFCLAVEKAAKSLIATVIIAIVVFTSTFICIYDMVGSQLMKLDVNAGYSSIFVNGSQLKAGMYLYSLIVDGKEIDTKRMILTDN